MATKIVYRDSSGAVVNIGPWFLDPRVCGIKPEEYKGQPKEDRYIYLDHNPIPEGVTSTEEEVLERADGGLAAASDYISLRRGAYPSLTDQLDAVWKGGEAAEAMRQTVLGVKQRFPK